MSGKKGMPHYSEETKEMVIREQKRGVSICALSRKYGISRYAIQSWCGLRKEVELRHAAPYPKVAPRQSTKRRNKSLGGSRWKTNCCEIFSQPLEGSEAKTKIPLD